MFPNVKLMIILAHVQEKMIVVIEEEFRREINSNAANKKVYFIEF